MRIVFIGNRKKINKTMTINGVYEIVGFEYPKPHFKGRFIVVCNSGEPKAFYPVCFKIYKEEDKDNYIFL